MIKLEARNLAMAHGNAQQKIRATQVKTEAVESMQAFAEVTS